MEYRRRIYILQEDRMSFLQTTERLVELLEEILQDVPKAFKGNKTAAQRVRTRTVKLSKLAKVWRKDSLEAEKRKKSPRKKKEQKRSGRKRAC